MLNEERVILMTHMASYEAGEGKKNVKIGNYFRSDYISVQVLKSLICGTIAFAIVFALYIFYDFEMFMQELYKMDLITFAKDVLICYAATVAGYGVLTYIICTYRYARAKNSLKRYYHNLKKLNSSYGGGASGKSAGGRK
ncbi:MAG: hypothetical protein OSJ69_12140 [Acetatifactor sp.]|nr:hypothetical protein [Acetatifactor sp.]